jgi:hypothetical protein
MTHREAPSCNGSQQESQKLTAKDGTETPVTTQAIAECFHNEYEALAPSFGYETRPETRKFNPSSNNGCLMLSVADRVAEKYIRPLERESSELKAQIEGFRKRYSYLKKVYYWDADIGDRCAEIYTAHSMKMDYDIDSALHHEEGI